uniref:RGS domain-containing protein n=1 Tax=Mesocestoides corti TaxID=53468 RepID=A0A5K3FM73_MESCO
MSYPPGSLRSCHEADGRSDRSGGSGGTGSGSGCGNIYGSIYNAFSEYKLHQSDSSNPASNSAWQKWSASFDALLSDGEGVALFKAYLESEGCGNLLDFWFAVQGFRSKVDPSDRKKVLQLIKVIYQTYIRGSSSTTAPPPSSTSSSSRCRRNHAPVRLRQETRRAIADRLSHKSSLDQTVFDEAQQEVGHLLRNTAYQAFLKSDAFIAHIQQGSGFPPESSIPRHAFGSPVYPGSLPTVEEDRELGVEKPPGKGSVTPASSTYHCFCGPQVLLPQQQQQAHIQLCSCQINSQWSVPYQPQGCYPQAAPLTQENLQITRFQRAELPVPQHLSSCPHCHTPYQQPVAPSNPLSPAQHKPTGRFGASSQRKWMDAVCPKHDYFSSPGLGGGFARPPPNPYHVSFAPVSTQDSEHHSISSGTHTEESLSHTDGTWANFDWSVIF